ncbi:hypothetical protein ACWT_8020 [Actinoplanes sp. SE50]|uniref:DUF742 domain-containing protein n=1 Tax=unclassified Actinoplanes TaxID=2626549 RepID=UPI00023EE0C5|nr:MULTISPECIES: DUF742 domain-containing protein [unclassified Actinoplanes]AEV89029.1 protein of unknown function DUF742 [Actinoplanes sp. SE50/110]ATO87435.1 hypothetical protein ACWT_8020 [Actinoplanes sp. SE50]SLM04853.1 hypothetical protein ACSP50_8165 [Actinoplanes sp. SE50/110]
MTYPDPADEPVPPARSGVRPFLQSGPKHSAGGYTPTGEQPPVEPAQTNTLRPFVITAGRTDGGDPDIGMETQVAVVHGAPPSRLSPETRAIVSLLEESPISVAEISARLRLHLGVCQILVGDLRAAGQVDVQGRDTDTPDPETIMRVIRGLRSIS